MTERLQDLIIQMTGFSEDIANYLNDKECLSAENRAYFNGVMFAYQDIQDMLGKLLATEMAKITDIKAHPQHKR